MLSSRYLYLHEALGLGPMWLKRDAKVITTPPAARTVDTVSAPIPAAEPPHTPHTPQAIAEHREPATPAAQNTPAAVRTAAAPVNNARAAALAAVGSHIGAAEDKSQENQPAAKTTNEPLPPAHDIAYYLETLAGRIAPAKLMVVSICPSPQDKVAGKLFSGATGQLLDNMLAAIGLAAADVHKTSWLEMPTYEAEPPAEIIERALPRMQAECTLSRPQALLLLGRFFAADGRKPLIESLADGLPVFYVPHPAQLLRQPQLKADAWAQLKKLREMLK